MTVEDDGAGFEPGSAGARGVRPGLGLLGVQERVAGFRGTFSLDSAPGKGTRLTVTLPALARAAPDRTAAVEPPSDPPVLASQGA